MVNKVIFLLERYMSNQLENIRLMEFGEMLRLGDVILVYINFIFL